MFDDHHHYNVVRNNYVSVTEKRAPTDESIHILREMESAARKEVLKAIALPSNDLKGVVHQMEENLTGDKHVAILFELNGKNHRVNVRLSEFQENTKQKKVDKLVTSMSEYLSRTILNEVMTYENMREIL